MRMTFANDTKAATQSSTSCKIINSCSDRWLHGSREFKSCTQQMVWVPQTTMNLSNIFSTVVSTLHDCLLLLHWRKEQMNPLATITVFRQACARGSWMPPNIKETNLWMQQWWAACMYSVSDSSWIESAISVQWLPNMFLPQLLRISCCSSMATINTLMCTEYISSNCIHLFS